MRLIFLMFALLGTSSAALADCPSSTPDVSRFPTVEGDQRVNANWLQKTLKGKRLVFSDGTEQYNADGSYLYTSGNNSWRAPSYRFYDNGFRCIDYPSPRFDYYVVNNGKIVLINGQGNRFVGSLRN